MKKTRRERREKIIPFINKKRKHFFTLGVLFGCLLMAFMCNTSYWFTISIANKVMIEQLKKEYYEKGRIDKTIEIIRGYYERHAEKDGQK